MQTASQPVRQKQKLIYYIFINISHPYYYIVLVSLYIVVMMILCYLHPYHILCNFIWPICDIVVKIWMELENNEVEYVEFICLLLM